MKIYEKYSKLLNPSCRETVKLKGIVRMNVQNIEAQIEENKINTNFKIFISKSKNSPTFDDGVKKRNSIMSRRNILNIPQIRVKRRSLRVSNVNNQDPFFVKQLNLSPFRVFIPQGMGNSPLTPCSQKDDESLAKIFSNNLEDDKEKNKEINMSMLSNIYNSPDPSSPMFKVKNSFNVRNQSVYSKKFMKKLKGINGVSPLSNKNSLSQGMFDPRSTSPKNYLDLNCLHSTPYIKIKKRRVQFPWSVYNSSKNLSMDGSKILTEKIGASIKYNSLSKKISWSNFFGIKKHNPHVIIQSKSPSIFERSFLRSNERINNKNKIQSNYLKWKKENKSFRSSQSIVSRQKFKKLNRTPKTIIW